MAMIERLFGFSNFYSKQRGIQISNVLLIYDAGDRAGFVVGSPTPGNETVQDVSYTHQMWLHGVRVLIAVLHEIGGYQFVDPEEHRHQQRMRQFSCERCKGTGQVEDFENNWMPCPECSDYGQR